MLALLPPLLLLAGCGPSATPASSPTPSTSSPTGATSWPTPVDGRFTAELCGLLVPADVESLGLDALPMAPVVYPTDISCAVGPLLYELHVQPNAESAGLLHDALVTLYSSVPDTYPARHTTTDPDGTVVITGARPTDASTDTTVIAHRHALVVLLKLTDMVDRGTELTQLAGLILDRAPTLGATDTGATHTVHYEVVGDNLQGLGRVDHLRYQDPLTGEVTDLTDVPLPWTLELPFFLEGGGASRPRASLAAFGDGSISLTCRLAVDGVDTVDDFGATSVTCSLPSA